MANMVEMKTVTMKTQDGEDTTFEIVDEQARNDIIVLEERVEGFVIPEVSSGDMLKSTYDTNGNGIVDNAEKVNGKTVAVNVPADAKFTDTTYSNATTSTAGLQSAADKTKLDALPTNATLESTYAKKTDIEEKRSVSTPYGTCSTAAGTAAKTVTVDSDSFALATGVSVRVKFSNSNSVASPTLNVNGTGAKAIKRYGTTAVSTSSGSSWNAGSVIDLTYDGTNWVMHNFLNTTYSAMTSAEATAGEGTSSRVITPARLKEAITTWAAEKEHTHNYAGSSSAGGSATSAVKLDTATAGSATQPSYFVDGKPSACTYSLNATVPSDAKFTDTDTKNTAGSTNSSSKLFLVGATSQAANPQTYSHDTAYVGTDGCLYSNSTKVSVEGHTHDYAPTTHTHDYLPLAGGTLTGELVFKAASSQPNTKGIKWGAFNSKNPYIGYCTSSSDGTFLVGSIAGTSYTTGLAIGGSSGNLLWKGVRVVDASSSMALTNKTYNGYTLGAACAKGVDTSVTSGSANLVTSGAVYTAIQGISGGGGGGAGDGNTTYTIATGDSNGQIKVTPSTGSAYNVSVKGLGTAAYTASTAYATAAQGTLATNAMPKAGGTFTGDVTHSSGTYFNASTYMKNNIGYNAYNTDGSAAILMCLNSSDELVIGSSAYPHAGGTTIQSPNGGVTLKSPTSIIQLDGKYSSVALNSYTSDNYQGGWCPITDDDGIIALGQSNRRWYKVYATTTSIGTSDEREKSDIKAIEDNPTMYEQLFDKLVPTTYTLDIEKTKDVHIGFIAQDIVKSLEELGVSEETLGIVDHEFWTDEDTGEEKDRYGLAYTEFIALNTYMIQKQKAKIAELEKRISELETA